MMEKVYEGVHKMSAAKEYGDRYRELYGLGRPQTIELVSFRFPCSMGVFVARIDSYRMWVGQNGRTGTLAHEGTQGWDSPFSLNCYVQAHGTLRPPDS